MPVVRGHISREFTVWCGECVNWEQTAEVHTVADAKKIFRKGGWTWSHARGWLCPTHSQGGT